MSRTGTEVDTQNGTGSVSPADAFALIGNETRLSILEAL
jgi:hypothetical protein